MFITLGFQTKIINKLSGFTVKFISVLTAMKFHHKYISRIFGTFLAAVFFLSCVREEFDPHKFDAALNLRPGLAIPVGYSHLQIEKYLTDSAYSDQLHIADDGFLSLYYSTSVASGTMRDLLSFQPISVNTTLINTTGVPIDLQLPGTSLDISDTISVPVTLVQTTARLDSIQLLAGNLSVDINSSNITGTITYSFPGLELNGNPFTITRNFSNPDFTINLADYSIIPVHDAGGSNILKCILSINLQNPAGPVNAGSPIFDAQVNLNSLSYETIFGDFSGYNISLTPFNFATDFFSKIDGGQFQFFDPKLKLLFSNSVGVPLSLSFTRFDAVDRNNIHIPLTGPGVPTLTDPKVVGYPALSQIGETIRDSLLLDRSNSNLSVLLASNPDSISMSASAGIVPASGNGTTFINHDSQYDVTAAVELPLWGKGEFLVLFDTMEFDYLSTTLPAPEELERVIVRLNITNSFPVAMSSQIYLLDQNRLLLDSLFIQEIKIEGASDTNNDGLADPHQQDMIDVDLPRSKIDILNNTYFLVTRGRITTTDFPVKDVKFYLSYYMDYNIGLIAQLKINTGK